MSRLFVYPFYTYYAKGEIKAGYWNPCGLFDDVHGLSVGTE